MRMKAVLALAAAAAQSVHSMDPQQHQRIYSLQHSVCCDQEKRLHLGTRTDDIFRDWRKLVEQLTLKDCTDEIELFEVIPIRPTKSSSRTTSSSRTSSSSKLSFKTNDIFSHTKTRKRHSNDNKRLKCLGVEIRVRLPEEFKREFNIDYVTPSDFDQLSRARMAEFNMAWGLSSAHSKDFVLDSSVTYKVTRETLQAYPQELKAFRDDDTVDQWAHRSHWSSSADDMFRAAIQYIAISSSQDKRAYMRNMAAGMASAMARGFEDGAFVTICGDRVRLKNETEKRTPNAEGLQHYFPLKVSGTTRQPKSSLAFLPDHTGDQCVYIKIENGEPEAELPTKVYLLKKKDGRSLTSMAFSGVSGEELEAIALSTVIGLDERAAVLSICSDQRPSVTSDTSSRKLEDFMTFFDFPKRQVTSTFGSMKTLTRDPRYPFCSTLAVFGVLEREYFSGTTGDDDEDETVTLIFTLTIEGDTVRAVPFWNVHLREVYALLGHEGRAPLSDAFAAFVPESPSSSSPCLPRPRGVHMSSRLSSSRDEQSP